VKDEGEQRDGFDDGNGGLLLPALVQAEVLLRVLRHRSSEQSEHEFEQAVAEQNAGKDDVGEEDRGFGISGARVSVNTAGLERVEREADHKWRICTS
jgi:hypothetical protein